MQMSRRTPQRFVPVPTEVLAPSAENVHGKLSIIPLCIEVIKACILNVDIEEACVEYCTYILPVNMHSCVLLYMSAL